MLTAKITAYENERYQGCLIAGSVVIMADMAFTDRELELMGNSVEFAERHEGEHAKLMYFLYHMNKYSVKCGTSERQIEVKNMLDSLENLTLTIRDQLEWSNSSHESKAFDMVTDLLVYQERFNK